MWTTWPSIETLMIATHFWILLDIFESLTKVVLIRETASVALQPKVFSKVNIKFTEIKMMYTGYRLCVT